jgi:hypothetical protein
MHVRITEHEYKVYKNKKINAVYFVLPLQIVNMQKVPDPDMRMRKLFELLIAYAFKEGTVALKTTPKSYGVSFFIYK